MTRDTPEQIYGQVLGLGYIDGPNVIRDALRAAEAEGRAAALDAAARIFDEKAREWEGKSKRAYEDDLTTLARMHLDAASEERAVATQLRSLLNQGRDEVAPLLAGKK